MKVQHRASEDMSGYFLLFLLCNVSGVFAVPEAEAEEALTTGNELWSGLVKDCRKPSAACVKNSIYDYLKDTLDYPSDVQFTSFLKFSKNALNYTFAEAPPTKAAEDDRSFAEETPLEEVTRSLSDNSRKFLMTHDLELQLPETFFQGTTLKVSPRSVDDSSDGGGTLLKMELTRREADGSSSSVGEGRIFFKKIQEYIGERLLLAFLAILVVIKLLAVKVLFVLPAIIGVAAAKKLILKIVLFLFPALHHLFKLCAYTPYGAKHHIHKHQISHIHQVAHPHKNHPYKHHYDEGPPGHHYGEGPPGNHYGEGPPGHHYEEDHGYGEPDLNPSGPYFGNEIISHRRDPEEENEVDGWGQGQSSKRPKPDTRKPLTPTEIENIVLKAEKEALIKSRLQKEKQRIHEENLRLQNQLNNALKHQEKLKQQTNFYSAKVPSSTKTRYPPTPLVPPPRPPPNKFSQGFFAEPPYSPPVYEPSQGIGHAGRIGNSIAPIGLQAAAVGNSNGLQTAAVGDSNRLHNAAAGNALVQQSIRESGLAGFKTAIGLSNNVGYGYPTAIDGTPTGFIPNRAVGGDLPRETVQAVENYLKQKTPQPQQQIYPVYNQNQPKQTSIQNDFQKPTQQVEVIKSVDISSSEGSRLDPPFESFPEFELTKPQKSPQPSSNHFEDDIYKAASVTFDPFYSPILEKIDNVLNDLDFIEEPCRERLICSMYKNPTKFSPHSNLLSSELSRDSTELKKPSSTNAVVVRFYKYVQAARDGQDQRDCIRLYPACAINTEL